MESNSIFLRSLERVVAVGRTATRRNIAITLLSVEVYTEGFRVRGRVMINRGLSPLINRPTLARFSAGIYLDETHQHAAQIYSPGDGREWHFEIASGTSLENAEELHVVLSQLNISEYDLKSGQKTTLGGDDEKWDFIVTLSNGIAAADI